MIIRGTTPYHNFTLPVLAEEIKAVYVTYLQNNKVILDKTNLRENEIEIHNTFELENTNMEVLTEEENHSCQLTVHLSQEDTLKFHFYPAAKKNIAIIQIRLLTKDGEAFASLPVNERIFGVFHDGVISEEENNNEWW